MYRALFALLLLATPAFAQVRVKDITELDGARSNQLYGFGLVVGLDGTGSRSPATQNVAVQMLQKLNSTSSIYSQLPSDAVFRSTSISSVMVTADLGPYTRKGSKLDVTVAVLDDAKSLQGGILLPTPLRGFDGEVYVTAHGALTLGGFGGRGQAASVQKNHLNVGRIPNGGDVVREELGTVVCRGRARLLLRDPDLNTARMIAKMVNHKYPGCAFSQDAGAVLVNIPPGRLVDPVGFLAEIEACEVSPDAPARIVINERTGTVVAGENVTISTTGIAHGNLFIMTAETPEVSQPLPPVVGNAAGTTTVVPRTQVDAVEQKPRLNVVPKAATVAEVARALNALGVSPRDLIAIFQSLKRVGALHAEIIVL